MRASACGGAGMSASGGGTYYYFYHNTLHDNYKGIETGGSNTKYVYFNNNIVYKSQYKTLRLDIAPDALANDMYWNDNVLMEDNVGDGNHVYGYGANVTLAWLQANKTTYFYDNLRFFYHSNPSPIMMLILFLII